MAALLKIEWSEPQSEMPSDWTHHPASFGPTGDSEHWAHDGASEFIYFHPGQGWVFWGEYALLTDKPEYFETPREAAEAYAVFMSRRG